MIHSKKRCKKLEKKIIDEYLLRGLPYNDAKLYVQSVAFNYALEKKDKWNDKEVYKRLRIKLKEIKELYLDLWKW